MKPDFQRLADVLVITVEGPWYPDMDPPSIHVKVKELLESQQEPRLKHVIVDLEHCPAVASIGIGMLIAIRTSVLERGGRILLCNVRDRVRTSLVVAGVWHLFDAYITRGEALSAIAAVGGRR